MSKKRIMWIDIAKGILIVLVVVGHCHINTVLDAVISSFHMAGFFVLSGITYSAKRKFLGREGFLNRKIKSIVLPYLLFCFFMLVQKYLTAKFITHNDVSITDGLISVFVPVSGRETTTVYGLWFLPCIFLSELAMYCFIKLKEIKRTIAYLYAILVISLCVILYFVTGKVSVVTLLPFSCFFIFVGTCLKKYIEWIECKKLLVLPVSILFFVTALIVNIKLTSFSFDFSSMTMGIIPLYLLSSIFGSLALFCVSMFIKKLKVISAIGKNSIYCYGFHYEILAIIKELIPYTIIQPIVTLIILLPIVLVYVRLKNKLFVREKHD